MFCARLMLRSTCGDALSAVALRIARRFQVVGVAADLEQLLVDAQDEVRVRSETRCGCQQARHRAHRLAGDHRSHRCRRRRRCCCHHQHHQADRHDHGRQRCRSLHLPHLPPRSCRTLVSADGIVEARTPSAPCADCPHECPTEPRRVVTASSTSSGRCAIGSAPPGARSTSAKPGAQPQGDAQRPRTREGEGPFACTPRLGGAGAQMRWYVSRCC